VTARAAVLRAVNQPMAIETIEVGPIAPGDVLVRIRAASLCHTDLEVIEGSLGLALPAVLGHEAAGEVAALGDGVTDLGIGDRVVLSWNPHCGHCFYCERAQPILCRQYLGNGPRGVHFDGRPRLRCDGAHVHQLMYLGAFAEYCVVPRQSAIRIADLRWGACVMVIGCGAVGLSAVQGARLAGAAAIVAVDPNPARLQVAAAVGATALVDPRAEDPVAVARALTDGRGADVVLECAGHPQAFRLSTEAVRPGGNVVWLGKVNVDADMAFRWGSLMQEKRIVRSSYGGARPAQDFPLMAQAYLDGSLRLDEMITARIDLADINDGFAALKRGETIRSVIMFD
jgi:S-(hydroxymethyl)glutathione dehydrogenase/alcohol dehydrogenase